MLDPVELPWLAIAVSFVASMAIGFLWYAKFLFGNLWMNLVGLDPNRVGKEDAVKSIGIAALMALAMTIGFAIFYGWSGAVGWIEGLMMGFVAWVAFGLPISMVHPTFEGRNLLVGIIYVGHHLVEFLAFGVIFGLLA